MKNVAELLQVALASYAKSIEKRLNVKYNVRAVDVKVTSDSFWAYEVHCFEHPNTFKVANSSNSMEECVQALEAQLTPRSELAAKLRKEANELMSQANAVQATP